MSEKNSMILQADLKPLEYVDGSPMTARNSVPFTLKLQKGENIFLSDPQDFGELADGKRISAAVSVCYHYMPDEKSIILCGSGYSGIRRSKVILMDRETQMQIGVCRNYGFYEETDRETNLLGQKVMEPARNLLNSVCDQLIKSAEEQGLRVFVRKDLFRTEDEAEKYRDLGIVLKNGAFEEFYQPEKKYGPEYQIVPLTSTYGGVTNVRANTRFYNVIGSTGDTPSAGGSWIGFWRQHTRQPGLVCTAHDIHFCRGIILGGHIVFHQAQQRVPYGSRNIAAILPICSRHNANPNMQMVVQADTQAVWLDMYHL